jgi:rRNA-processing protein FCF1
MRVIINDANILIDLVHLSLIDKFVLLPFDLKITDFVYEELHENQRNTIQRYIDDNKIELIITESEEDFTNIATILENTSGLSFEDCSVWHYANKLSGIILTGDGRLRKQATKEGISVKGILFVFDNLLIYELITFTNALERLNHLCQINSRLPINAIDERIVNWTNKKHILLT